jgi:hypothetical protein
MIPTQAIGPPVFDDQRSYVLHLSSAEVRMDMASLTHLMNDHVFAHEGSPLTHVTASEDNGRLAIKGTLHKGVAVPFSAKATIGRAGDGRLRLHTEQVSAFGIPATKVMDIFGLELDDLVSLERRAITVRDDDILMAAGEILPPPVMRGNLSDAKLTGNRLMMRFSPGDSHAPPDLAPPRPDARGYVYFSGASIQFGKLTMTGADLQLIDADDRDPFDFFPARYRRQLVAGYSKNTPEGGLATYMPDYDDVDRTTDLTPSKPATTSE